MGQHQPAGELSEAIIKEKEKQQYLIMHAKFGEGQRKQDGGSTSSEGGDNASESSLGIRRPQKKREHQHEHEHEEREDSNDNERHSPSPPAAATNNEHAKKRREQKHQDKLEQYSARSHTSKSAASSKSKYGIGDKLPSGVIKKAVNENNWELLEKKGGRDWFMCKLCKGKAVRKDNRETHSCV